MRALAVVATAASLFGTCAHAQLAVSVSAVSDFRYRGGTIGSDQPAVSLNLAYDTPVSRRVDGYAGAAVTGGWLPEAGAQVFSQSEYVGLAGPLYRSATWDIGVENTVLATDYGRVRHDFSPEVYTGVKTNVLSYYFRYSPHYFADGVGALYGEVDGSTPLSDRWRLVAHVGALTPVVENGYHFSKREQYDGRIGIDLLLKHASVGMAWTFQRPGYGSFGEKAAKPDALVVTASYYF